MAPASQLAVLFTRFAVEARDAAWLADEFLALAADARRVVITRDPEPCGRGLYCRVDGGPGGTGEAVLPDPRPFGPLMSRLAWVFAEERGTDPLPVGGRLLFTRGGVRIEVVFANTPAAQHLTATARPADAG